MIFGSFLGIFGSVSSNTLGDMIDTGSLKAWETCAMCHGVDGNSHMEKFPKLAGQPYDYLAKQLRDFKAKRRDNGNGMMIGMTEAKPISELLAAAKYFSALEPPKASTNAPKSISNAKILYAQGDTVRGIPGCISCHGAKSAYPHLQAQHAGYLKKQLEDFKYNRRKNDANSIMRRIASMLTKKEINELAFYLASQTRISRNSP